MFSYLFKQVQEESLKMTTNLAGLSGTTTYTSKSISQEIFHIIIHRFFFFNVGFTIEKGKNHVNYKYPQYVLESLRVSFLTYPENFSM